MLTSTLLIFEVLSLAVPPMTSASLGWRYCVTVTVVVGLSASITNCSAAALPSGPTEVVQQLPSYNCALATSLMIAPLVPAFAATCRRSVRVSVLPASTKFWLKPCELPLASAMPFGKLTFAVPLA